MTKQKDKTLQELFDEIIIEISETGCSAISAIKNRMATASFYSLLKDNTDNLNNYARATELRADRMAEEMLSIADNIGGDMITLPDGREVIDQAVVNRDRLRVDSRKWLLSKMNPKKFGEKIDMTSDNKALQANLNIMVDNSETAETLKRLRDELANRS
jgi:hypothetical protein